MLIKMHDNFLFVILFKIYSRDLIKFATYEIRKLVALRREKHFVKLAWHSNSRVEKLVQCFLLEVHYKCLHLGTHLSSFASTSKICLWMFICKSRKPHFKKISNLFVALWVLNKSVSKKSRNVSKMHNLLLFNKNLHCTSTPSTKYLHIRSFLSL